MHLQCCIHWPPLADEPSVHTHCPYSAVSCDVMCIHYAILLMAGNFTQWEEFVREGIHQWETMLRNWIVLRHSVAKHPLLIIKYEDLKREPEAGLRQMLDFLKVDYGVEDVRRVVNSQATRLFQRTPERKPSRLSHFTATQRALVERSLRNLSKLLSNRASRSLLSVNDYLEAH